MAERRSAVVVMPRSPQEWAGAEALWITARGWARAAERRLGEAWIATPTGTWRADELPRGVTSAGRGHPYPLPPMLRTLLKDLRLGFRQSRFRLTADGPWSAAPLGLVWEHHDLFNRAGEDLARRHGVPLVRYVHAPQVWEARKWGVRRPLWGAWLESLETRHLQRADLVACVSNAVRQRLEHLGVDHRRTLVVPMGVDAGLFTPDGDDARSSLGLPPSAVVVGWCGSFRRFHGLERLFAGFVEAARRLPELHFLWLGDGPMRVELEEAAARAGLAHRVHFAGRVDHRHMPRHLRALDIAAVSSDPRGSFHYSPLKLREYAACGLPVVAPAEGEMAELSAQGASFLHLHPPGDTTALAAHLEHLAADPVDRRRQAEAARAFTLDHWTWDAQLARVLDRLGAG